MKITYDQSYSQHGSENELLGKVKSNWVCGELG